MTQLEPGVYRPSDEIRVFDGAEDDHPEEGSRLPLLIVIALLVFMAFGGVVWLAYNQGVKHGREDVPIAAAETTVKTHVATRSETPYGNLKIYQPPKAVDQEIAREDAADAKGAGSSAPDTSSSKPAQHSAAPPAGATTTARKAERQEPAASNATANPNAGVQTPKPLTPQPARAQSTKPAAEGVPTALATAAKPAPPAETGALMLQIGSYKSEAEAMDSWRVYKTAHPAAASYQPDVKQAEIPGKGTWYRLRIGPFSDAAAANAVCAKLKTSGAPCFPAKR